MMFRQGELQEIFEFIAVSSVGKIVLRDFLPEYQAGKILIKDLAFATKELGSVDVLGSPCGGFLYDGTTKVILLENVREKRLAAPLLLHEMIHSMDQEYLGSYAKLQDHETRMQTLASAILAQATQRLGLAPGEVTWEHLSPEEASQLYPVVRETEQFRQQRLFRAERRAYSGLYDWVSEMTLKIPAYGRFLAAQYSQGHVLDRFISDDEIIHGYCLNSEYVKPDASPSHAA